MEGKAKAIEITNEATDEYNGWLQGRLQTSVWMDCMSYYRLDGGVGKIVATFPGPVALFWWLSRKPKWGKYKVAGGEEWEQDLMQKRYGRWAVIVVVLLSVGIGYVTRA